MDSHKDRKYCVVDHANKQKELARWTPYEFWLNQVRRGRPTASKSGTDGKGRTQ
ncbi:MAG TPA: hypothetical protein VNQ14_14480 [Woeseiaceae bacterium]|nr:hypothetical protein [Woeseiaceae bacterium]